MLRPAVDDTDAVNARARDLLREADALLRRRPDLLVAVPRTPQAGGAWMRDVMRVVRGTEVAPAPPRLGRVIVRKYVVCAVPSGLLAVALALVRWHAALPCCALLFYALEARRAFDVPLAVDGRLDGRGRRRLERAAGGRLRVMRTILPIALSMTTGGLRGRGAVRAWCVGCAAVVLWYERVRLATSLLADERP